MEWKLLFRVEGTVLMLPFAGKKSQPCRLGVLHASFIGSKRFDHAISRPSFCQQLEPQCL